ncbi:C3a anaphylatoxin chemotactic receptor-like [Hydractinia symbiolongicarpus]|uniref:C3a anaphylatoxin chemotactic receptor-like n=1 Tax=Hydractinia symbiolongicarpus TaxID=13093 RepID=UPI00254E7279|nr:C3a anaphylatoxin chemotactic receptor-like [Hydractinia symbiolongicarpus]
MDIFNETTNGTSSSSNYLNTFDKALVGIFSLIFFVGVLGNSFVIYVFGAKYKHLCSKQEILILLLAVVDLIASIANPAVFLYYIITKHERWDFGEAGCKIIPLIGPVATSLSQGIILIMALDRDRAIVTPLKSSFSRKTIYKAVAVALLLSILSYFDFTLYMTTRGTKTCSASGSTLLANVPRVCHFLISDLVFLIIFVVTILRVYIALRKKHGMGFDEVTERNRKEKNKRTMRLLLTMGTAFALCIYPGDLFQLAYYFSLVVPPNIVFDQKLLNINSALKVFHTANSCVNVFIYAFIHPKMKLELKRQIRRLTLGRRTDNNSEMKGGHVVTSNKTICNEPKNANLASPTINEIAFTRIDLAKNNENVIDNNNSCVTMLSVA